MQLQCIKNSEILLLTESVFNININSNLTNI